MKKLYISALFLMQLPVFGQTITFQDQNFKSHLLRALSSNQIAKNLQDEYTAVDLNGDGEIQVSEALQISYLNYSDTYITSIQDVHYFSNLEHLSLSNNRNLTSIEVAGLQHLWWLSISNSYINHLAVNNCPTLSYLDVFQPRGTLSNFNNVYAPNLSRIQATIDQHMNYIDVSRYPLLENLSLKDSRLQPNGSMTSMDLSQQSQLRYLTLELPQLTALNHNSLPQLKSATIKNTLLSQINLSNSPLLDRIELENNAQLTHFEINDNPNITRIKAIDNPQLSSLNLAQKPLLNEVNLTNSNIHTLDFTGTSNLQTLTLSTNPFEQIDLSPITGLRSLYFYNNGAYLLDVNANTQLTSLATRGSHLQYLNVKNGNTSLNPIISNRTNSPNLRYICTDPSKFTSILQRLTTGNFENVEVNDYCSFTLGGAAYTIEGKSYFDVNNNEYDVNDIHIPLQAFSVIINGSTHRYTSNTNGLHHIATVSGTTSITPYSEIPGYFNFTPASASYTFPTTNNLITQDFKVTANGVKNDLETIVVPFSQARPGEVAYYKILYKNKGNTTQSGTLQLSFDQNISTFISSNLPTTSQNNGNLSWNFSDLAPFEKKEIIISLRLNRPTDTPSLDLGDFLNYTATIVAGTDQTPTDNTFTLNQEIVNAYDPNDKTCLEGETISPEKVGEYVHYKIRFENLGTANAKNIVVRDEIDLNKFDISTLVPLDASHHFFTKIRDTNVAEFIFENIQLPFDDENNDGYVVFKIKTKPNLRLNDTFSNTAKIYFDYNHPIVTNTYTTTVRTLGTDELVSTNETVSIYPNPVKDQVHFQSKESILKAEVYDANGRLIFVSPVQNNSLNVKELSKGNYIIKTYSKNGVATQKMMKK